MSAIDFILVLGLGVVVGSLCTIVATGPLDPLRVRLLDWADDMRAHLDAAPVDAPSSVARAIQRSDLDIPASAATGRIRIAKALATITDGQAGELALFDANLRDMDGREWADAERALYEAARVAGLVITVDNDPRHGLTWLRWRPVSSWNQGVQ